MAAIKDCWNRLEGVARPANGIVRIDQISADGIRSLEPDGIFAIVGLNGSGKSCFFDFLTNLGYNRLPFLKHNISLYDGTTVSIPGANLTARIVDPSSALRKNNQALEGLRSTFGQQELIDLKQEETYLLNYVLNSTYNKISLEEIQISDSEVCIRFIATSGDLVLDNDGLSLGEQLVLYLYWALTKKFKDPGMYFLEEPESGLAPSAQKKLVDLLVYISSGRAKQIFISTHSPFIVSRLGPERVLLLKKDTSSTWVNAGQINYLEELGMDLGLQGIFYVEDNKARVFLKKLLSVYGSEIVKTHDVIFLGGEAEVFEVVRRLQFGASGFKMSGILDGDQRGIRKYGDHPGRFHFLPGTLPPERELIKAVLDHQRDFARALMTKEADVLDAIRRCRGLDHHDFFEELSRLLYDEVRPSVYEQAFAIWFSNYPQRAEIHELLRAIDPSLPDENIHEVDRIFPVRVPPAA